MQKSDSVFRNYSREDINAIEALGRKASRHGREAEETGQNPARQHYTESGWLNSRSGCGVSDSGLKDELQKAAPLFREYSTEDILAIENLSRKSSGQGVETEQNRATESGV